MKVHGECLYVTSVQDSDSMMCYFWCPGCEDSHCYWIQDPERPPATGTLWTWNDSVEKPTFQASLLLHPHPTFIDGSLEGDALTAPENITSTPQCHLYVTDGIIDFLGDCTHHLAGQKVPLPPLPDWMRKRHFDEAEDEG